MSLLWQIIISVGSGIGGVIVGGLLNHSLMIRQEHKLRIFNERIEAFSKFSKNTDEYIGDHYSGKIDREPLKYQGKRLSLSNENKAALKEIMLIGSLNITDDCAALLNSLLSSHLKADPEIVDKLSSLLELLTKCMKYDLGHTSVNLNRKPKGKSAKNLERQVKDMEEKLFPSLNS